MALLPTGNTYVMDNGRLLRRTTYIDSATGQTTEAVEPISDAPEQDSQLEYGTGADYIDREGRPRRVADDRAAAAAAAQQQQGGSPFDAIGGALRGVADFVGPHIGNAQVGPTTLGQIGNAIGASLPTGNTPAGEAIQSGQITQSGPLGVTVPPGANPNYPPPPEAVGQEYAAPGGINALPPDRPEVPEPGAVAEMLQPGGALDPGTSTQPGPNAGQGEAAVPPPPGGGGTAGTVLDKVNPPSGANTPLPTINPGTGRYNTPQSPAGNDARQAGLRIFDPSTPGTALLAAGRELGRDTMNPFRPYEQYQQAGAEGLAAAFLIDLALQPGAGAIGGEASLGAEANQMFREYAKNALQSGSTRSTIAGARNNLTQLLPILQSMGPDDPRVNPSNANYNPYLMSLRERLADPRVAAEFMSALIGPEGDSAITDFARRSMQRQMTQHRISAAFDMMNAEPGTTPTSSFLDYLAGTR